MTITTMASVLCHGTDTLASHGGGPQLPHPGRPQAHRPHRRPEAHPMDITDSKTNLWDSFAVACDGRLPGVTVVFGGRILLGTRARKTYSKSYGAFSSINHPILGVVREGKVTPYLCPQAQARPTFYHALDQKVSPGQAGAGAVPRTSWPLPWRPATGWWWRASAPAGSPRRSGGGLLPLIQKSCPGKDDGLYHPGAE